MTFTLVLTDEEMVVLRAAMNIRTIQRPRAASDPVLQLSDRLNTTQPDREESHAQQ